MSKKLFVVSFVLLCLAMMAMTAFADQEGNASWCNMDNYGCWVTNEEGGKDYIMFWSEEARQYFMGDKTAPYANVTDYCADCTNGRLPLEARRGGVRYIGSGITYIRVNGKLMTRDEYISNMERQGYTCEDTSNGGFKCTRPLN